MEDETLTDTAGEAFPELMCARALCEALAAPSLGDEIIARMCAEDQLEARALWALQAESLGTRELYERIASEARAIDHALAEMQYAMLFARADIASA